MRGLGRLWVVSVFNVVLVVGLLSWITVMLVRLAFDVSVMMVFGFM